ncbi:hypothetical protein K439DRAFT_1360225 [Ramaria rubella]|nr:hypothetical protein K439DRAFT_1360225 [Ramaria rubella]
MRCEFPKDSNTCRRCKSGGHQCIVEGRKPRSGPNKREYLLAQLRQKEAIIDSLLKQINNPAHRTPLNLALPSQPSHTSATPEPTANKDVLAWIEKMHDVRDVSVRTAGGAGGASAFCLDGRADPEEAFEDDDADDDGVGVGDNDADQETEADAEQPEKEKKSKLHSLPEEAAPLGLIANLSLRNTTPRKPSMGVVSEAASPGTADAASPEQDNDVGVANATYFLPGPATNLDLRRVIVERTMPPEILVHGLVTPDDVEKLFEIFYERLNPFISLLDPAIHTPARTFGRCPFLFTVVCAVASRYYAPKADIYKYAMHFAKSAAATSLIDGWKSVELCQAYLLMSIYSVPARRWEEDRSWLYLGLAIRIATDLNLHQPTSTKITSEKHEREVLNRTRTWMICFNLDRSTSTQLGKPSTIKEDFIIRNSSDWYKRSAYNLSYDVHLCAYTELLRLVTRFHEEVYSDQTVANGLNKPPWLQQVDFYAITMRYDDQLRTFQEQAAARFERDSMKDDPGSVFRTQLLPFIVNYSRLVMFSFGFQHAVQRGLRREDIFFQRCFDAACAVITTVVDRLAPTGYMRFAPDGHFIFSSFASAFLLKLLRPDFAGIVAQSHRDHILALVGRFIKMLGSSDIAVDDRHTPKLYSRFLAGLVARYSPQIQEPPQTVPKLEPSPVIAPMSSLPDLSVSTSQSSDPLSRPSHVAHIADHQQYSQHMTLSPASIDDIYSTSSGSGHTVTQYGMEETMPEVANDDLLASMQAIDNPVWWGHVMMPGFSWPDATGPTSSISSLGSGDQNHQVVDPYAFVPHDPLMQHDQHFG